MTVANPSFVLEAKARDCPPLQFVREFTQNALEAIATRRVSDAPNPGQDRIVWREFTEALDLLGAKKLCCIDTGTGIEPDNLERYISSLAATSKRQDLRDGNYGMGAKIAGAAGNPAGVTYLTWTGGPDRGWTCTLKKDPETGVWGLNEDSVTFETITPADQDLCPVEIQEAGWRGTCAVFHGTSADHDTVDPPTSESSADWLLKAINTRFYELPEDVDVRCARAGDPHLRRALGHKVMLDAHTEQQGEVRLPAGATVKWRILTDDHKARAKLTHRWAATGHRAALHDNELYDLRLHAGGGYKKLQEFGILFGHERVALLITPDTAQPDTVRARLIADSDGEDRELPWEQYADEFIAAMPDPLRELVEKAAGHQATRDRRDILRRLQQVAKDMPIPRYEPDEDGPERADHPTMGGRDRRADRERTTNERSTRRGDSDGSALDGNVLALFTRPDGSPSARRDSDAIPEIRPMWIEPGERAPGVLEDLGASYLPRQGVVHLSADFRGHHALLAYHRSRHGHLPGGDPVIVAEVRAACEDQVIEYIVGVLRLRCQPHWTSESTAHALDDRALTACLMQHATLAARIEERLNRRLRKAA